MIRLSKVTVARYSWLYPLVIFLLALLVLGVVLAFSVVTVREILQQTRGVTYGRPDDPTQAFQTRVGVNAALEQYSGPDLARAFEWMQANHMSLVRQHFYWNAIEPRQGQFDWSTWDQIVDRSVESRVDMVAVLDTTPEWARDAGERDLLYAPPARVEDYAAFVTAFVERYRDRIRYLQVWDNPNIHPFWGGRNADPAEYARLLHAASRAARAANPDVRILAAGLAPNSELVRGHPDLSDVLFLRGMYHAGARADYDILAAKPYGMWTGPEDRRVAMDVSNFSRIILLREEMLAQGDDKPVWAVEFGWNALPGGWEGKPSPWGNDAEEIQSVRLKGAVQRARGEWPWLQAMLVQSFQPNAAPDDPQWGFALVSKTWQPRLALTTLNEAIAAPIEPARFEFTRYVGLFGLLALVATIALWRGSAAAKRIPWANGWRAVRVPFLQLPEWVQWGILLAAIAGFYFSRNTILNFGLLAFVVVLFALRLDIGLSLAVITIPFYLLPKNLVGSMQFSLIEILTLTAVAAWVMREVLRAGGISLRLDPRSWVARVNTADWAILFFVLAGLVSVKFADNFGVANREFRVIVLEPAFLFFMIRVAGFGHAELQRLVDAFVLSAVAVSLVGLYQFAFTNWVIVGEGVRRVLAVYGSPNNLALYLDRALPLVLVFGLYTQRIRRRVYLLAALPMALCWYLTYSRAAYVGMAAALVFVALLSGRRVRLGVATLLVVGALALMPFLATERGQSFLQTGTGTGFFRLSVMQAGVEMIRDHPVWGVGLDNFLYEYGKYIKPDAWREPNLSHPHNILLDFWVRMGILGVVALGWMLLEFYRRGLALWWARGNASRILALALMASMTAALAHGMMDAAYFYVDLAFVWMFTLALIVELADQN